MSQQIHESLVKQNSHALSKIHALKYKLLATFGNIPKVDTTMNENKMKNQKSSWCTMPPLSKEKERKEKKRKICYQIKGESSCVSK